MSFLVKTVMYLGVTAGAVGLYAINNKPSRESFTPHLKTWIKENIEENDDNEGVKGMIAKKIKGWIGQNYVKLLVVPEFKNLVACRIALVDEYVWIGAFNDWYLLKDGDTTTHSTIFDCGCKITKTKTGSSHSFCHQHMSEASI